MYNAVEQALLVQGGIAHELYFALRFCAEEPECVCHGIHAQLHIFPVSLSICVLNHHVLFHASLICLLDQLREFQVLQRYCECLNSGVTSSSVVCQHANVYADHHALSVLHKRERLKVYHLLH
eukprot:CAMPEP_0171488370 /NCGR_PEP_ID=MMETSP0958-20121227/2166_1 /TAXON_ID=87120 /ORGANISM="Aurantiochytrium limacinum, Strain ATCCMYA-1381" /LENGTH=122 /DNA_ID=CAMNT_0012021469 /DNA_START=274 /DNA_END=642 /DNA_ORIENTATION=-